MRYLIDLFETLRATLTIEQELEVSDIIDSEFLRMGYDEPHDVNEGYCYLFADNVVKSLGGPNAVTYAAEPKEQLNMERAGQTYDPTAPAHVFIVHHGRIYDSETPEGVDRWQDLPYYQRHSW